MDHDSDGRDDEGRSLTREFGIWLALLAASAVLLMHLDARGLLQQALVSTVEQPLAADPHVPSLLTPEAERPDDAVRPDAVTLAPDAYGHHTARVEIDGRSVLTLVDTGASLVMLTFEDARRVGLHPRTSDFTLAMDTANGSARAAPVVLERVELGPIRLRHVPAAIAQPGRLSRSLLGMSFLRQLRRSEIVDGRLVLHP